MNIKFMMMNTLDMKKYKNLELKLTDSRKTYTHTHIYIY